MSVSVQLDAKKALRALSKLKIGFSSKEYLTLIGSRGKEWLDEMFKVRGAGGSFRGLSWDKLDPNTILRRRKKGKGAKILQDIGDLKRSTQYKISRNGNYVDVGYSDVKAKWHHKGTRALARSTIKGIPARPLLPSVKDAEVIGKEVLTAYRDHLVKQFNRV